MRTKVYRRWLGPEVYVEVLYRRKTGEVDIRDFSRDPRKSQHHKPKYWNKGLWMPWRPVDTAIRQLRSGMVGRNSRNDAILKILEEDIGLTSSTGRALAS